MCGIVGHSERDCAVVCAHPNKKIDRAYGTWLQTPGGSAKTDNLGARWLRTKANGPWPTSNV